MIAPLAHLLDELAADAPGVEATSLDGATTWLRGAQPFCATGPRGVELRLERAIAAAAAGTPDAGPSSRGPEWVRFNPRELDAHAVDRVTAWFGLAYRLAGS